MLEEKAIAIHSTVIFNVMKAVVLIILVLDFFIDPVIEVIGKKVYWVNSIRKIGEI